MRKLRNSSGIAVIVTALALTTLLSFVILFVVVQLHSVIRAQLQTASDAAALAASTAIISKVSCGSEPCSASQRWSDARNAAVIALRSHSAYGNFGGSSQLTIDLTPTTEASGSAPPTWNSSANNIAVTIERGRWLNGSSGFQSYEGSWQDNHPGVPVSMAFNAIRVSIARPAVSVPLFGTILSGSLAVQVTSTSAASSAQQVTLAPFAIPVCALIQNVNSRPDFYPQYTCLADRLIAATRRHCPSTNVNCGNIPQFSWDPRLSDTPPVVWLNIFWPALGMYIEQSSALDKACFWSTPRYEEPGDNYGVFGLATSSPANVSECTVTTNLSQSAQMGATFYVLKDGLRYPFSQQRIWQQIINPVQDGITYANTDLGGTVTTGGDNINDNIAFSTTNTTACAVPPASNPTSDSASPRPIPPSAWPDGTPWPIGGGTCNSMRTGWGYWSAWPASDPAWPPAASGCLTTPADESVLDSSFPSTSTSVGVDADYSPPSDYSGVPNSNWIGNQFGTANVWQPMVAVIADTRDITTVSASDPPVLGCSGMTNNINGQDPPITDAIPYEIIGMIRLNVYDVDIGHPPPYLAPNTAPFTNKNARGGLQWSFGNGQFATLGTSAIAPGSTPTEAALNSSNYYSFNWSFIQQRDDETWHHDACNVVRTRIPCDQTLLPSVQFAASQDPILVPN